MNSTRREPSSQANSLTLLARIRARRPIMLVLAVVLAWCAVLSCRPAESVSPSTSTTSPADPTRRPPTSIPPFEKIERVLIVSIDGLRPDLLLLADSPTLHDLIHGGSYSLWARTTEVSVTLPSHTSMLTGAVPARHGVTWNGDPPKDKNPYPKVPTLFDLAKQAGLSTALVAGKTKFASLNRPGSIDHVAIAAMSDRDVAGRAVEIMDRHRPQAMFVHFPGPDLAGHSHGWGSPQQLAAIAGSDQSLAAVLSALEKADVLDKTLIIISADHGGAGLSHGANDVRSRTIPWIVRGPGIRAGYDLTRESSLVVNTEDTFATAASLLGLRLPAPLDGKFVVQALVPPVPAVGETPAGSSQAPAAQPAQKP